MISKSDIKYFSSLNQKKYRKKENRFLAEGLKIVLEGIKSKYECEVILVTYEFADKQSDVIKYLKKENLAIELINFHDFQKISDTKTPQGIIGVFKYEALNFSMNKNHSNLLVYFDNISDPGNLGTIIRTCHWFDIKEILISPNSSEFLNPKVVRASMGSIFHLKIYDDVEINVLKEIKSSGYKIICSDLRGENIFNFKFPERFVITLSSESAGPSEELVSLADKSVTIPKFGNAESLNVSVAAGIILSRIKS